MRVAQVGHSLEPTVSDVWRTLEASQELPVAARNGWQPDVINLAEGGRDFLLEHETYDVVLVHSVISPKWGHSIREGGGPAAAQVSEVDSYTAWHDRLVATGARWIVVFEGARTVDGEYESLPGCLSGWDLTLPGYRARHERGLTVFTRRG